MKYLERLIGLTLLAGALAACGGGGGGSGGTTVSSDGGGGGEDPATPRAEDPMDPAPAPEGASFEGRQYQCQDQECEQGKFAGPFAEPTIRYSDASTGDNLKVVTTDDKCLEDSEGDLRCKPAAGSIALLPDNRLVYFNALEGTENVEFSIVAEFGFVSVNDQTRVLNLGPAGPEDRISWQRPSPVRGGANVDGNDSDTLLPGAELSDAESTPGNDGALFCADVIQLADGRIMAVGGTDYYTEPSLGSVFPRPATCSGPSITRSPCPATSATSACPTTSAWWNWKASRTPASSTPRTTAGPRPAP
ncbi:hypothetical protein HML84_05855 [Alcanivorax sp. IO_7]|nr:hypothetical protein HML84_05855 [Alcanivorax sp. IO_7]